MGEALLSLIDRFTDVRVIVAGDAMLDIYTVGTSTRMMPEAENAPVVLVNENTVHFGGAGNAAANITLLGGACDFICLMGDDVGNEQMTAQAQWYALPYEGFIIDKSRPTIIKERIIVNGRYVTRIDREKTHDIDGDIKDEMLSYYKKKIDGAGAVVLSDYCKGTLSNEVIRRMIKIATDKNIPVLIDSKRPDLSAFYGALLAKPNMKELAERTQPFDVNSDTQIESAAHRFMMLSGVQNLIASRSEKGMMLVTPHGTQNYPATARRVAEVSGAGDTVLSVAALALAAGASLEDAVWLANLGAGVAVEKEKTSTITPDELKDAVLRHDKERKRA